jgi:hypothetical protein
MPRILSLNTVGAPAKNPFFLIWNSKSGSYTTPISRECPNKAKNEPRLISDNPLFDRKLLDILHEEGVRKNGYDGGSLEMHMFSDGEIHAPT